jgi:hypothetical protein
VFDRRPHVRGRPARMTGHAEQVGARGRPPTLELIGKEECAGECGARDAGVGDQQTERVQLRHDGFGEATHAGQVRQIGAITSSDARGPAAAGASHHGHVVDKVRHVILLASRPSTLPRREMGTG